MENNMIDIIMNRIDNLTITCQAFVDAEDYETTRIYASKMSLLQSVLREYLDLTNEAK